MIRLYFIVEGATEKEFVDKVISPYLAQLEVVVVAVELIETNHKRGTKGGMTKYTKAQRHIRSRLSQDAAEDFRVTTMFDLYALPPDFPSYEAAKQYQDPYKQVEVLESGLADDINRPTRFIPYIQLHEFEALLFADIQQLDWEFLEHENAINNLNRLAESFGNPELINDSPSAAPSKRIIAEIPEYERSKSSVGPLVAEKIGLQKLRQSNRHFDEWLTKLEKLSPQTP